LGSEGNVCLLQIALQLYPQYLLCGMQQAFDIKTSTL
jgi:hypothetical protein